MYSNYWDEYSLLLKRYVNHQSEPELLIEIQHAAEELAFRINDSRSTCIEQDSSQLTAWESTCLKFAASCARKVGALNEAVNLYRAAIALVPEIEAQVELVLVLCESKRWSEACLHLNSLSDHLVIDKMPEAGAELLQWICSETVLACGVCDRVLRLCVLAVNQRSPIGIQLGEGVSAVEISPKSNETSKIDK